MQLPINDKTIKLSRRERGFTLIEILVTVIVLAIGLLGIAGLQLTGLRYNHSAYQRSQVIVMTNDITDRMRANRTVALTGAYDIAIGGAAVSPLCEGVGVNCAPNVMAGADLAEWKQALTNNLPSGDGSIVRNGAIFTITVQWDDTRGQQPLKTMAVETIL